MSHATMEWLYVGVVIAILCYIGADAWHVEHLIEHTPAEAQVIRVTGQQWFWTFEHEDGTRELGEVHLVKDTPYRFEITSLDVIHSFNTPDFAMTMDAVPGRITSFWVAPDQAGEFLIQCKEYCGFSHYQMRARMFVEEPTGAEQTAQVTNASATDTTPTIGSTAVQS
jgi:cytochrome c oxidase subunit II